MNQEFWFVCKCGARANASIPGSDKGWRHLTQPSVDTCPACLAKENRVIFDKDYFLHGKQTGKSLYENYRWLPNLTIPMVWAIVKYLGIRYTDTILDFGCARGYTVRALREMGYKAFGVDISEWAIANCDPMVRNYVSTDIGIDGADWVIAKDVLEHIPMTANTIHELMEMARVGVFAVVPLGYGDDGYVIPEYNNDVTHIHKWSLPTWAGTFMRPGWSVTATYQVKGIKDNYAQYPTGNGFITARRIAK